MDQVYNFPPEIHKLLSYYVYRLIDPRNGSTFYIGKGSGNRVFAHVNETLKYAETEDSYSEKISTIQQIKKAGLEPIHIIHRHGLTEEEAFAVEAALIDATPGISNSISGKYSNELGPAHVKQLITRYSYDIIEPDLSQNLMLISINKSIDDRDNIYDAVRYAWVASIEKAQKSDYILAISRGICQDVFVADKWLEGKKEYFPGLKEDMLNRIGFIGKEAPAAIRQKYRLKRLPPSMMPKKGAANPVRYFYGRNS